MGDDDVERFGEAQVLVPLTAGREFTQVTAGAMSVNVAPPGTRRATSMIVPR